MSNKCDDGQDMAGYVHITKDKDVMTVIPKMLMMLHLSASVGCFITEREYYVERLKSIFATIGPAEPRAEGTPADPATWWRGGLFGPGQGWLVRRTQAGVRQCRRSV